MDMLECHSKELTPLPLNHWIGNPCIIFSYMEPASEFSLPSDRPLKAKACLGFKGLEKAKKMRVSM